MIRAFHTLLPFSIHQKTKKTYMRAVGLGKEIRPFPADEVHTLYRSFCRLRDEYPHQDLDWIEQRFEELTRQFYKLCTESGGTDDGSHEDLAH